jgi:hypothetical protein
VSQCWIGLKGGEQLRGDIFVNATAQMSFKYLRDSVNPQGLECCDVGRVEWEEFVCSRMLLLLFKLFIAGFSRFRYIIGYGTLHYSRLD